MAESLNPRVTVVMLVYNAASFLKEAVSSILGQTFTDFELLIIDDGSTDGSDEILKTFSDSRIRYIKNSNNEGIVASRNKGIVLSRTEYIAMMDADDVSKKERLAKQVEYLDNNKDVALIATRLILIDDNGKEKGIWPEDKENVSTENIKHSLPSINCIGQSTVMIRKSSIEKYGYNSAHWHSEDWGLWLTLLSEGFILGKLDEVLVQYRVHSGSLTVRENKKGILQKIIKFKYSYVKDRLAKGKFKNSDYCVLYYLLKDILSYVTPRILISIISLPIKVWNKHPIKLFKEFLTVSFYLSRRKDPVSHVFFFPYFHTGGAEKVHAEIITTIAAKKPIVFVTGKSTNYALYDDFKSYAALLDVHHLVQSEITKKWLLRKIKNSCLVNDKVVTFGCNSKFYYELIPLLPDSVKCIDLLHAFVHTNEDGPEKWSLPVVSRLSNRVVINQKTIDDFRKLYAENNIPLSFVNRIVSIPNYVDEKMYVRKDMLGNLKVLYVGRGGEEKRVHLISKTASYTFNKKFPVEFHFVGDLKNAIPANELQYCILHGEITDQKRLEVLYESSHILIIASSREGFPMVIMEAMMNGVVPIATNVGGISEHIIDSQNGVLIENSNPDGIIKSFVSSIEYFCNHRERLNELSVNAYHYALANFKKEVFVKTYLKLLAN